MTYNLSLGGVWAVNVERATIDGYVGLRLFAVFDNDEQRDEFIRDMFRDGNDRVERFVRGVYFDDDAEARDGRGWTVDDEGGIVIRYRTEAEAIKARDGLRK